jgi:hypothetical protein
MTAAAIAGSVFLLAVGAATPAMAAGENLVVTGDFSPNGLAVAGGKYSTGQKLGGWDVNAPSGSNPNLLTVQVWYEPMPEPGKSMAAPYTHGPWARVMGSISQAIPTEVGKTYVLEYLSRATGSDANDIAAGWGGGNRSYAAVDGVRVDTFAAVLDPFYTTRSVSFTATATSTVISFGNVNGGAVGFDSISVVEVPENDSPLMLPAIAGGVGMAAIAAASGFALRRKNKPASR